MAGDNCIFEGTTGLPAVLTQRLHQQGLTLALSEQFSGGLLNLQLHRAGAPLVLAVSAMSDDQVSVVLHTPRGGMGQTVRYRASHHSM